jgi:VanZ family protein
MRSPLHALGRLPRPLRLAIYALACLILLYITLAPGDDVPGVDLIWDKAEHALAWAVLTGAGLLLSTKRRWAIGVFAFGFGAAVEVAQAVMPLGRDGDWRDLLADTTGIVVAYLVWAVWRRLGWVR